MPKCAKCQEFFPPNYTEIIEDSEIDGISGEYPQNCIFCKLGINQVERESEKNSGNYVPYTKQECLRDYKEFVAKIKSTSDIINNKQDSRIIIP